MCVIFTAVAYAAAEAKSGNMAAVKAPKAASHASHFTLSINLVRSQDLLDHEICVALALW